MSKDQRISARWWGWPARRRNRLAPSSPNGRRCFWEKLGECQREVEEPSDRNRSSAPRQRRFVQLLSERRGGEPRREFHPDVELAGTGFLFFGAYGQGSLFGSEGRDALPGPRGVVRCAAAGMLGPAQDQREEALGYRGGFDHHRVPIQLATFHMPSVTGRGRVIHPQQNAISASWTELLHDQTKHGRSQLFEDQGGGLARINGQVRLVESLAIPREEDEFRLTYYNTMTTWIDIDQLLSVFELDREQLADETRVTRQVRRLSQRLPTYLTLKDVKKRWGQGQEDIFPVAQFEKLWGDMSGLAEVGCQFVWVPASEANS